MKTIVSILGVCTVCCAFNAMAGDRDELVIDIPAALSANTSSSEQNPNLDWIRMDASAASVLEFDDQQPRPQHKTTTRELLNKVSIGAWTWENGTALRLSGDRIRVSYGEKMRVNFTLRPFRKNEDMVSLTVNRSF